MHRIAQDGLQVDKKELLPKLLRASSTDKNNNSAWQNVKAPIKSLLYLSLLENAGRKNERIFKIQRPSRQLADKNESV